MESQDSGERREPGQHLSNADIPHLMINCFRVSESFEVMPIIGAFLNSDAQFLFAMPQDIAVSNVFFFFSSKSFFILHHLSALPGKLNYQETLSETVVGCFVICSHLHQQRVLNGVCEATNESLRLFYFVLVIQLNFWVVLRMQGLTHGMQIYY